MIRTVFAVVAAGLIFAAVYGSSQAAPIAPLPAGATSDASAGNITHVWYHHHHWHHWCRWHRC